VQSLRFFFRGHARLAALIVALALALRALVPGGYMISAASGFAVVPCPAAFAPAPQAAPATQHDHHAMMDHGAMAHPAVATPAPAAGDHGDHAAAQQACAYAVLSLASLAGADPVLLAAALAFVLALGFARRRPVTVPRAVHLRPQLRGPPPLTA
jgi:hypothetical protein